MKKPRDYLLGEEFGDLLILARLPIFGKHAKDLRHAKYLVRCRCNVNQRFVVKRQSLLLTEEHKLHCGCKGPHIKIAASKEDLSLTTLYLPEYRSWGSMLDRCYNPRHISYKRYGGRGIKVYAPWTPFTIDAFQVFLKDMGLRPTILYTLDRVDPDKDYTPENTRWSTVKTQNANKRRKAYIYDSKQRVWVRAHEYAKNNGLTYANARRLAILEDRWRIQK